MVSCGEEYVAKEYKRDIDLELQNALINASQGAGMDYFRFPQSNVFSEILQDPNNPITKKKVELGKNLYHETAFATEGEFPITIGEYSCASCHHAGAGFQSGLAQGLGEGGEGFGLLGESRTRNLLCAPEKCDVQPLRTPTTLNVAYQPLMLWNGQFGATSLNQGTESQWKEGTPLETNFLGYEGVETQAIAGLKVHRMGFTEETIVANGYKDLYDEVFADFEKDERYTNVTSGLAIAAYERTLMSYNAPFQKYVRGNPLAMTDDEKKGAILFFEKGGCANCHNGPALNNKDFHALGMNEFDQAMVTHFNPEDEAQFGRYQFTGNPSDKYKFKTPQLYNLKDVNFFGHGASFSTVKEVIEYKNKAVAQNENVAQNQLDESFVPLGLTDEEVDQLTVFIESALFDPNLDRFVPSSLPSGACFPNADDLSIIDLECN